MQQTFGTKAEKQRAQISQKGNLELMYVGYINKFKVIT